MDGSPNRVNQPRVASCVFSTWAIIGCWYMKVSQSWWMFSFVRRADGVYFVGVCVLERVIKLVRQNAEAHRSRRSMCLNFFLQTSVHHTATTWSKMPLLFFDLGLLLPSVSFRINSSCFDSDNCKITSTCILCWIMNIIIFFSFIFIFMISYKTEKTLFPRFFMIHYLIESSCIILHSLIYFLHVR